MARTLLLAPPSLAAHPEALDKVYEMHDRTRADLQMLDRLAAGLVQLPAATYDVVLVLTDAHGSPREGRTLLGRDVVSSIAGALRPGGVLRSQDSVFGADEGAERTEAILAGLVAGGDGMVKPEAQEPVSIPLKLGKRKTLAATTTAISATSAPRGVGMVDFSDDLDDLDALAGDAGDAGLVDEDALLTEADRAGAIVQPVECRPKAGKRRRACKDCTCGMKEALEAEDAARRAQGDAALNTMKLAADDLDEVDFTVQGKVGSCGNCALGDAFRCDGCPYIGLPAFKPGDEVRLLNNDIQL